MSAVARLLRGEKTVPGEYRGMRTDGSLLDIEVHSQLIRNAEGQPNSMMIIVRDITKRKRSEERITTLLAEKELLLKEVHHRIKNNMNTVKALLSLQGSLVKDPVAVAALKDAGSRVQSMMQLYDKLYRSEGFTSLPTDDYLSTLLDEIIGSFPNRESVRVEKHLDPIVLDARRMSSLGMVVNELITNMMKYAFVGRDHGLIAVSASLHGKRVRVMVRDDGIGMPDMLDPKRAAGFGLKLVDMLTEQLEGTIHAAQDTGTVWILEFDL
jgi:two-component sensor histidine kinase